jgi:hypothetical protein
MAGRLRLYSLIQIAVVLAVIGTTGALLAFDDQPSPSSTGPHQVRIGAVNWTKTWAANGSRLGYSFGGLAGTCLGLAGSNFSGANFTCYFEAEAHLQQQNGSGPYAEVSIITVTTNPPFSVAGIAYYILYGCANCQTFGVIISLPAQSGSFALTGTVEYAVSDT